MGFKIQASLARQWCAAQSHCAPLGKPAVGHFVCEQTASETNLGVQD
jgi:hypothetical protein